MHLELLATWSAMCMLDVGETLVRGAPIRVWDSHRKKYRLVFPVLVFAFADTPARRSWALTIGHTGFRGCDKCSIKGIRKLPDGTTLGWTAFCGYYRECHAAVLEEGAKVRIFVSI